MGRRQLSESYCNRLSEYRWFANAMRAAGEEINFNSRGGMFRKGKPASVADGCTAEEAIHRFESTGVMPDTCEPDELYWLLLGKYSRDWHITQWGEGLAEGTLRRQELVADKVPEAVILSARQAAYSVMRREQKELADAR